MNLASLLQRSEGDTLDFKQENYRFHGEIKNDGSVQEGKVELLKDILAMANAWKATDAYIVIGVSEANGRAIAFPGVEPDLYDEEVQQFVNGKTNRPVEFSIEHREHDGVKLTVIRVGKKQPRPIFLHKPYKRLKQHVVYLRRGSSTDEASPDEIAEMAKEDVVIKAPQVSLLFQITIDSYCTAPSLGLFRQDEPTYTDSFDVRAMNKGDASAKHIEGWVEIPRGVFLHHVIEAGVDPANFLDSVVKTKPIRFSFSNYLRTPVSNYMMKPNPREWMPVLPGRCVVVLQEMALRLRNHIRELDAEITWELAVDDCALQTGRTPFCEITIVGKEAE